MKKLFISALVMLATVAAGAQVVNVASISRVDGAPVGSSTISPDGTFVVAQAGEGLVKFDLATGTTTSIAQGTNLYGVRISPDGNQVVYTRVSFTKDHLRMNSLESADLTSGATRVLVKPTRQLNAGASVTNSAVTAVENGKARVKSIGAGKAVSAPVASISYGHLQVTVDGKTVTIDPQGRGSYIWPSVSPDGTRVVYRLVGVGTYTCNLDGSDVRFIGGNCMYPAWAGNDVIVAVNEVEGQNQEITAASIVAHNAHNGIAQVLTDNTIVAGAPTASADGSKVAFNAADGQLYIITLNK